MLEINVSEQTEQTLKEMASQNNQSVADFAGKIVEKEIAQSKYTNINGQGTMKESTGENNENPLMKFCGMFSSGKTDTSERMSELLREEDFDPAEGFSIR